MKSFWLKISTVSAKLTLVDKFLILFMFIFLMQSTHNLFAHETISQEASTIDTIVRTSAASIFGYFLSGHFRSNRAPAQEYATESKETLALPSSETAATKNKIGFDTSSAASSLESGKIELEKNPKSEPENCNNIQIILISCVGLFSLLVLLLLRNFFEITPQTAATISQLRDFISACVGFLVGCGKKQ